MENKLYYLDIDNTALVTKLMCFDINTKEKTILLETNDDSAYFSNLVWNGSFFIVEVIKESASEFYQYNPQTHTIEPYFYLTYVDSFVAPAQTRYVTWAGDRIKKSRMRPQFYLMDTYDNIVYEYNDSVIYPSEQGMLWVKFLVEESTIPKLEIFKPSNSELMWYPMNH